MKKTDFKLPEKTTITLGRDTHKEITLFKIKSNARDMDEALKLLLKKLKKAGKKNE